MKKMMAVCGSLLLAMVLFAGVADAHVTVLPKETTQGSYEKFTVRVPNEKNTPTVKVEVKFPVDNVAISRFEPKPGWSYTITKDGDKVTGVVWTATGDGLSPTEFGEFNMQGKVADAAKDIVWKAYQTYKDGTVVEWTQEADANAKTPASVTTVKPKPTGGQTDSHGNTTAGAAAAADTGGGESKTPLILSIAALVLGALALIVSLVRRAK